MRELMSYLPENYPASRETTAFQEALQPEAELMWRARDELLAQLDLYTATWGLSYWERALGLPNGGEADLDGRRRAVAAKLQGRAATTPQVVKDVAETLLGTGVTVIELFGEYTVMLETEAGYRPGPGAARLGERLREMMPAHLDWQMVFPALIHVLIRPQLGIRLSESSLPDRKRQLLPGPVRVGTALGCRMSITTLPAQAEGGQ